MPPSASGLSRQAVGWALLSQAIWLPLLLLAAHDRWLTNLPGPASGSRSPVSGSPLPAPPPSLRDLEGASGSAAERLDPSAAAARATAAARGGLVLRSPAETEAFRQDLPAGSAASPPPQRALAAGSGAGPMALHPGLAAGSPALAVVSQLRPASRPGPPADRRAAVWPGSRSEAASPVLGSSGAAQPKGTLSQRLGGAIGLRDLTGGAIGAIALLRPGSGEGLPAASRRGGQAPAAGRPASDLVWPPPPPLPPLP